MRNEKGQFVKGHDISNEMRDKMSIAKLQKPVRYWLGKQRPDIATLLKGERSHFWQGGKTSLNKIVRESAEYNLWRKSVFERDNYTCQECGLCSGNGFVVELNADHIKPFSLFPEQRFAVENGRTLCRGCHIKTDTFGARIKTYVR